MLTMTVLMLSMVVVLLALRAYAAVVYDGGRGVDSALQAQAAHGLAARTSSFAAQRAAEGNQ